LTLSEYESREGRGDPGGRDLRRGMRRGTD
jgi:hypothetical protein